MSASNAIYLEYSSIISTYEEDSKNLRKKISEYNGKIGTGENTILLENEIQKGINELKESHRELDSAYSNKNAPSQISPHELDRRQKQIQKLGIGIQDLEKDFKALQNKKYSFKGPSIEEYQPTEDMKTMTNNELIQLQKEKIKDQDKDIDDIILDVKKGKVMAKETGKIIDEQNKQLDLLQDDLDKLDSRLARGAKRFANFVAKQNGCCIMIILFLEIAAGILIMTLL